MKQTKLLLVAAITLVAFFTSCKKSTDNLTNAIPASAITVIHIDTKALLQKADYKPLNNKIFKEALEEQKQRMTGEKEVQLMAKIEELLKNPNNSGLDVIEDCFMYMDSMTMGIVWGVNDQTKLKELLTKTFEMPEQLLQEEDGVTIIDMSRDGKIGWTKDKFLAIMYSNTAYAYRYSSAEMPDLKDLLKKQLKQSSSESINSNKSFAEFMNNQKDISVFYSYDNAMAMWDSTIGMMMGMGYYDDMASGVMGLFSKVKEDLKGIDAGGFISFEKGEIVAENKVYFATTEAENRFKELSDKLVGEIKGDHMKYMAEKPVFLFAANLKGQGVYDYLDQLGVMDMITKEIGADLTEQGIDLKALISNVEGDMTIALNALKSVTKKSKWSDYEYQSTYPEFAVFADTKDAAPLWNLIKGKINEQKAQMAEHGAVDSMVVEVTPNMYSFQMDDNLTGYFGVNDNTFFITNREDITKALGTAGTNNDWASQGKGKVMFMYGNLGQLTQAIKAEMGESEPKLNEFVNEGFALLGDYIYTAEKDMTGKGKLEITDKSDNSLAVIVKFIDKIITYAVEENM